MRIEEAEDDEVVLLIGMLDIRTCVVDDQMHIRFGVGMLRVLASDPGDDRVDLNGVDHGIGRVAYRGGGVVSCTGAQDEHTVRFVKAVRHVVQAPAAGEIRA